MASAFEPEVIILSDSEDDDMPNKSTKTFAVEKKLNEISTCTSRLQSSVAGASCSDRRRNLQRSNSPKVSNSKATENENPNFVGKDPIIESAQEYLTVAQKLQKEMGIFSLKDGVKCRAVVGINGQAIEQKRRSKSSASSQNSVAMWNGPPERSLSKKTTLPVTANLSDSTATQSSRLDAIIFEFTEKAKMRAAVGIKEGEKNPIVELFHLCRKHAEDKTDNDIIENMVTRVRKCDPAFIKLKSFQDFTWDIYKKISDAPRNRHMFLKEFLDELSRGKGKKVSSKVLESSSDVIEQPNLKNQLKCSSTKSDCDRNAQLNGLGKSSSSTVINDRVPVDVSAQPSTSRASSTTNNSTHERRIHTLEKMLEKCSRRIRKFEEKEMTLDDLDDEESTYLLIEKYKARCIEIWNKLCEITNCSPKTGRVVQKKFVYNGSRYPEVNKQISRKINREKNVPDYVDILKIVQAVNEEKCLRLSQYEVEHIAIDSFKDVGQELKRRRIIDYEEHFGCPDQDIGIVDNDPADHDEQLNNALKNNKDLWAQKRDNVFDEFLKKQEVLESQGLSQNDGQVSETSEEQQLNDDSDRDEDSYSDTESVAVLDLRDDTESDEASSDLDSDVGVENIPNDSSYWNNDVGGESSQQGNAEIHSDVESTTSENSMTLVAEEFEHEDPVKKKKTFQSPKPSTSKRKNVWVQDKPVNSKRVEADVKTEASPLTENFVVKIYNGCENRMRYCDRGALGEKNCDAEIVIIN